MASRDASAAVGAAAFAAAHASDRCAMTEEDPVDEDGRPVMTSRAVLRIVREAGGFTAPEMNDKLWLHNRRWRKISGLEEFTGAAMLHLGNNHIGPDIGEGLRHLVHLKALHLPRNQIRGALDDNLRHNANLKLLDLSANRISRFPSGGLPPSLNTLLLVGNALEDASSIAPLAELPDLEVLDLKDNKLDGDALFELFPTFLSLKVLYLQGNSLTGKLDPLRGCTAPSRPHGAACGPGRAACQVTEGGTPSRTGSAHRDEQVPAGVERVHGLHDDVRTRRVAREAAEHAFDRAHESRVASRIVRGHSGGAGLHLECTT